MRNEYRQVERLRGMKYFPGGETQFVGNTITNRQWRSHTSGVRGVRTPVRKIHNFWCVISQCYGVIIVSPIIQAVRYVMTFFDCTADLVRQLNGNRQKGMLQIDTIRYEMLF